MNMASLKSRMKKLEKVYAFFWGLPFYRKLMYFLHVPIKEIIVRDNLSKTEIAIRAIDMVFCLWVYGCTYTEYNLYDFSSQNHHERSKYIGDCTRKKYYMKLNSVEDIDSFRNKYQTYQAFQSYYGRAVYKYRIQEGYGRFGEIVRACGTAMVKPATASGGYGVMKVAAADEKEIRECFDAISNIAPNEEIIIEEYVRQVPELMALHPSSLNTVRIITVVDQNGEPHILGTLFRVGKGGMVVDNGASGGILCAVSEEGTILKCLDKKNNRSYLRHPDTDHLLVGFKIPCWDAAKNLAKKLARKKTGIRYCGWDLALSSKGWIMIEGNEGAELAGIQIFGGGCKDAITKYI